MAAAKTFVFMLVIAFVPTKVKTPPVSSTKSTVHVQTSLILQLGITPSQETKTSDVKQKTAKTEQRNECSATIQDLTNVRLNFSKLLQSKTTQIIVFQLREPKTEYSVIPKDVLFYWVKNEKGKVVMDFLLSKPIGFIAFKADLFYQIISLGSLLKGEQDFDVPILQISKGETREELNNDCLSVVMETILKQIHGSKMEKCSVHESNQRKMVVCCEKNEGSDHCEKFGSSSFSEIGPAEYVIVFVCIILSPFLFDKSLDFSDNQRSFDGSTYLAVPHNLIIYKCVKFRAIYITKIFLLLLNGFLLFLAIEFLDGTTLILVSSYLSVVLSLIIGYSVNHIRKCCTSSIEEPPIDERIGDTMKILGENWSERTLSLFFTLVCHILNCFVRMQSYCLKYSSIRWIVTDEGGNSLWSKISICCENGSSGVSETWWKRLLYSIVSIFLILDVVLLGLLAILLVKHTLLGLLLNSNHYLPYISAYTIAILYLCKAFQSLCATYSSLIINVGNVMVEIGAKNREYRYDKYTLYIKNKEYVKVAEKLESYRKNIFIFIIKVIFITIFAILVFGCVNFLENRIETSFEIKAIGLFGLTTLPHLVDILFWDQDKHVKKCLQYQQLNAIKAILQEQDSIDSSGNISPDLTRDITTILELCNQLCKIL